MVRANIDFILKAGEVLGHPNDRLFAVGPMAKGRYWEVTAVPEIRPQTESLAEQLAGAFSPVPVS